MHFTTNIYLLIFFICSYNFINGQDIEVAGNAKIIEMSKVNQADSLVVRLPDGTLAVRDASSIKDADADPSNELQMLQVNGDTIFISNGNFIVIPGLSNVGLIPTCEDNVMNGNETDIDCGGPACPACPQLDIIVVVDNSGDMAVEMAEVEDNLNRLADSLTASIIDWRIILISEFSSICIPPPLHPNCGAMPENTNQFYHYSSSVNSHNALCKVIDGFDNPDAFNLTPNGYQDWLRTGTPKIFIVVTSDGVSCTSGLTTYNDMDTEMGGEDVADDFESTLSNLSPTHFGTINDPNYQLISIIGISGTHGPLDPVVLTTCPAGVDPGTGYQVLSRRTNSMRYSSCSADYGPVFDQISMDLISLYAGI